jgi:hypothetical protein
LQAIDDGAYSSHLAFFTKLPGQDQNPLIERLRITSEGNIRIGGSRTYLDGYISHGGGFTGTESHWIMAFSEEALRFELFREGGRILSKSVSISDNWSFYAKNKNFLIDHPLHPDTHQLVHSTLEGPEIAVFYRGETQLSNGQVTVTLPDYFEALTRRENRTVLLTPKFENDIKVSVLAASEIKDSNFTVKMIDSNNPSQKFYWEVKAVRADVDTLKVERAKIPIE